MSTVAKGQPSHPSESDPSNGGAVLNTESNMAIAAVVLAIVAIGISILQLRLGHRQLRVVHVQIREARRERIYYMRILNAIAARLPF
jgi:hypothetical protein